MDGLTFILTWILLSYPIVKMVNERMKENDDDTRFQTWFQIFLFFRAQFEVPRYYFLKLVNLMK